MKLTIWSRGTRLCLRAFQSYNDYRSLDAGIWLEMQTGDNSHPFSAPVLMYLTDRDARRLAETIEAARTYMQKGKAK